MAKMAEAANEFDCDTYRLIARAERLWQNSTKASDKDAWAEALRRLRSVRNSVRRMMTAKDQEATSD